MIPSRYFFREIFEVDAGYDQLTSVVRKNLNTWFYKGYIDLDDTQVFFTQPGSGKQEVVLPFLQVNFRNQLTESGKIQIQFKVVPYVLVFVFLFGLTMGYGISTMASNLPEAAWSYEDLTWQFVAFPVVITALFYIKMYNYFSVSMNDLKYLIDHHTSQKTNTHAGDPN